MQQFRPEAPAMTCDEISLESSKSFVKALQELKNLRPQLYSAAEYCEKSYFHNEEKQMVMDNLKGYAVQALVNAVDHLGTVAYKLTDLLEKQTLDVSTVELKISCLNQQILTCQTYIDKGGLGQQRLLATIPRHHKHYILPNSSRKKVQRPQLQTAGRNSIQSHHPHRTGNMKALSWHLSAETNSITDGNFNGPPGNEGSTSYTNATDAGKNRIQSKRHHHPTGNMKALSWHLAAEIKSIAGGNSNGPPGNEGSTSHTNTTEFFQKDAGKMAETMPSSLRFPSDHTSNVASHTFHMKGPMEVTKPLAAFKSFHGSNRREIHRPPVRSKSLLVAFFAKNKYTKQRKASAA